MHQLNNWDREHTARANDMKQLSLFDYHVPGLTGRLDVSTINVMTEIDHEIPTQSIKEYETGRFAYEQLTMNAHGKYKLYGSGMYRYCIFHKSPTGHKFAIKIAKGTSGARCNEMEVKLYQNCPDRVKHHLPQLVWTSSNFQVVVWEFIESENDKWFDYFDGHEQRDSLMVHIESIFGPELMGDCYFDGGTSDNVKIANAEDAFDTFVFVDFAQNVVANETYTDIDNYIADLVSHME